MPRTKKLHSSDSLPPIDLNQILIDLAPDVIYSVDLHGRIVSLSPAFEKLTGWKASRWIGHEFGEIVHPDDVAKGSKQYLAGLKGKIVPPYELRLRTKKGTYIPFEFRNKPHLVNGKIIGKVGIARDISERKKDSEALATSEERYRTLVELAPDVIYSISIQGLLTSLSPSFEKLTGWQSTEWLGRPFAEIVHPDDLPFAITKFKEGLVQEVLDPFELRIRHKNGGFLTGDFRTRPHIVDGHVIGLVGIGRDITYRKQVEEELRNSRNQLQIILQGVANGITVQDKFGKLIFVNSAAAIATGFTSPEEMLSANPSEFPKRFQMVDESGESFPFDKLPGRRALAGEPDPKATVLYKNIQTKEERWVQITARPIFDELGKVVYAVNIMHDLTAMKEYEKRKDDFISMASHELKTPLTSLLVYAELLKRDFAFAGDAKHVSYIQKMHVQLDKLNKLVTDLLDISRIQRGKLEFVKQPFQLHELVNETVEMLQATSSKHTLTLENGIKTTVFGDRDRIGQVLINLLSNAIKYSPKAETVKIKVEKNRKYVQVSVQDFGIGIDEMHHKHVFKQFYQVGEQSYPGLGIGLFIATEIMKAHQGKIWVKSEKGKGSTFSFSLPLYTKNGKNHLKSL